MHLLARIIRKPRFRGLATNPHDAEYSTTFAENREISTLGVLPSLENDEFRI